MRYEVRPGACDPRRSCASSMETFSVGIGEAVSRKAAIYRVSGSKHQPEQVDRLANRLVAWLNDPGRTERCPHDVPCFNDGAAKIHLTAAGKRERWLRP